MNKYSILLEYGAGGIEAKTEDEALSLFIERIHREYEEYTLDTYINVLCEDDNIYPEIIEEEVILKKKLEEKKQSVFRKFLGKFYKGSKPEEA